MFGVLTITEAPLSFWPRMLLRIFPSRGLALSLRSYRMSSFRVAEVTLPSGLRASAVEKRILNALRELRAAGVRRLVAPERWQTPARALGFAPVDESLPLRACAAAAVLSGCRKAALDPSRTCVTICADTVDRPLSDQMLTLARAVRTLRLHCPQDLPVLRRRLLDACGIAAEGPLPEGAPEVAMVLNGTPPESAVLAVDLTGTLHAPWPVRTLLPSLCLPEEAMRHCPENAEKQGFLCALYLCGGLTAHEIGLDITEPTQYNNEEN